MKKHSINFLKIQIQEEEAGSARLGNRDIQVNYYMAEAYRASKQQQ